MILDVKTVADNIGYQASDDTNDEAETIASLFMAGLEKSLKATRVMIVEVGSWVFCL